MPWGGGAGGDREACGSCQGLPLAPAPLPGRDVAGKHQQLLQRRHFGVTGLRFPQAGAHCRETPALLQTRRVLTVHVCCMPRLLTSMCQLLSARLLSIMADFFPVSFLLGKSDVSETCCFLGKHICGQKILLPAQEHQLAVLSAMSRLQTLPTPSPLARGSGQVTAAVGLKPAGILVLLLLSSVRCACVGQGALRLPANGVGEFGL